MPQSITQEVLYELVWAVPMAVLCKEFALSDRGLAKLCRRLNVPVPPRGYWRRLECGVSVTRAILPDASGPQQALIGNKKQDLAIHPSTSVQIPVPLRLTKPHRLIASTIEYYDIPEKYRWQKGRDIARLDFRISDKTWSRGLRIFDTLIKALERHKFVVKVEDHSTFALLGHHKIPFHLHEYSNLTVKEDPEKTKTNRLYRPERIFTPTGRLSLVIDGCTFGVVSSFREGKRRKLEEMLGEIVEAFKLIGEASERREKERHDEQRLWLERDQLRRQEEQRIKRLLEDMEQWEMEKRLKRYFRSLRRDPNADSTWVRWVEGYLQKPVIKNGQI